MVLYLCSDKAGFITGENICIDGGMTRQMIYHNDCGLDAAAGRPAVMRSVSSPSSSNKTPLFRYFPITAEQGSLLLSQDALHGLSSGQLIHQLVQISDFPHQGIFDFLYPDSGTPCR